MVEMINIYLIEINENKCKIITLFNLSAHPFQYQPTDHIQSPPMIGFRYGKLYHRYTGTQDDE